MSTELSDLIPLVLNCGGPGSGRPGPCPMGGSKGVASVFKAKLATKASTASTNNRTKLFEATKKYNDNYKKVDVLEKKMYDLRSSMVGKIPYSQISGHKEVKKLQGEIDKMVKKARKSSEDMQKLEKKVYGIK